ncbi:MAG: two-component system sensor kinase FixL [Salibacteraceae bacterium]|jgi:two-component system sensor kinase FixL
MDSTPNSTSPYEDSYQDTLLRVMFEHAAVGIVMADEEGAIVLCSPYGAQMFGYEVDAIIGQQIETLIPNKFHSEYIAHFKSHYKNPVTQYMGLGEELLGIRKDGQQFPVEVSLSYAEDSNHTVIIALINDITQRTLSEEALKKEQDLNELKSRFVSMASHEFRTPLTTILSSASLVDLHIKRGNLDKYQKHLKNIKIAVTNLTFILNDFLSLEKLESGKVRFNSELTNLSDFIPDVLEEVYVITKSNQTIHYLHSGSKEANIDQHCVRNILINLLSNAIKYSTNGDDVDLYLDRKESSLVIEIKDKGIGIPEDQHELMFSRFFRASNVSTIQGTGVGLTIVKRYLDIMGGKISFKSKLNLGTTFIVEIPL